METMEVIYDKDKKYTIDELEEIKSNAYNIVNNINDRIQEESINGYDFSGKYIYYKYHGYMYVTWQKLDKGSTRSDTIMFFQGLFFNANLGDYRDDAWFDFDALKEWRIPIDSFERDVKNGDIKEVTKEEFLNVIKEHTQKLEKEIFEWADYLDCPEN